MVKKLSLQIKNIENAKLIGETMRNTGFDVEVWTTDIASRKSIQKLIVHAQTYGEITMLINAAGVSPSQASIETILNVDLYGTAVLLEEAGKVIKKMASVLPFLANLVIECLH